MSVNVLGYLSRFCIKIFKVEVTGKGTVYVIEITWWFDHGPLQTTWKFKSSRSEKLLIDSTTYKCTQIGHKDLKLQDKGVDNLRFIWMHKRHDMICHRNKNLERTESFSEKVRKSTCISRLIQIEWEGHIWLFGIYITLLSKYIDEENPFAKWDITAVIE